MSFLKKIFSKKSGAESNSQYLAGWEVQLDGQEHCNNFIKTQLVDKETAQNLNTYIELNFDSENLLADAKLYSEGVQELSGYLFDNLKVEEAIGKLKFEDLKPNRLYGFEESDNSLNYLGGKIPDNFKIPNNKCQGSFQYLGRLSNKDQAFNWLPFDLHLICPIYLDIDKLWIDYKDPLKPKILNKEEIDNTGTAYDDLKGDSFISFERKNFKTIKASEYGFAGVPNWIQYPDIPICPESKRTMKFLCQIDDCINVKVSKTNVEPADNWYKQYFQKMNFWGDGDLFVFFEPKTKIACYFIQNT